MNSALKYSVQRLYDKSLSFINVESTPIDHIWHSNLSLITFKALKGLAPSYLCCKVNFAKNTHQHFTRFSSQHSLQTLPRSSKFKQRTFSFRAPLIWNKLPEKIRNVNSLVQFKHSLKNHFKT